MAYSEQPGEPLRGPLGEDLGVPSLSTNRLFPVKCSVTPVSPSENRLSKQRPPLGHLATQLEEVPGSRCHLLS